MKRVTGLGGIFIKFDEPDKAKNWYKNHLGLNTDAYGTSFEWRKTDKPEEKGYTVWSPMAKSTDYFEPSKKDFMLNFRVENLEELLIQLQKEGVQIVGETQTYNYGKFAHIIDFEGNKIELWESFDDEYGNMTTGNTTF